MDEEKGPYADFLDQITRFRVKMLNDLIDFEHNLTIDELEDEIRERQNSDFLEGRAVHFFNEVTAILEYVPDGFELDLADEDEAGTEEYDDFPDLPEEEEGKIEEDETMKWDEEETRESEDLGDGNVKDEKSDNSAGALPKKNTGRRGRSRKK